MNGIDISKWQTGIDLSKVPCDFVIVKATENLGYVNHDFKRAMEQGLAAGKRMGVYHYAGGRDPILEAKHFLRIVEPYIGKAILCLDWERTYNISFGFNDVAWCRRWLDYVRGVTGITPFLYISAGMRDKFDGILEDEHDFEQTLAKFAELTSEYHLWAAQYANEKRVDGYIEHPWNEDEYHCDIRQYTNQLHLPGWNDRLDGNKAYLSAEEWDACAKPITDEPDEPKDMPTIDELARDVLDGKWGNGDERRKRLEEAGYDYDEIQARVNAIVADEEITRLAQKAIHGDFGNGAERKRKLGEKYEAVQKRVNEILGV